MVIRSGLILVAQTKTEAIQLLAASLNDIMNKTEDGDSVVTSTAYIFEDETDGDSTDA